MKLDMIRARNEAEDLILSITENSETLIKQTHKKAEETLDFKLTKRRETFSLKSTTNFGLEGWSMISLTSLEAYNCIFIKQKKKKFELFTDKFDEFLFGELKDELEEILSV